MWTDLAIIVVISTLYFVPAAYFVFLGSLLLSRDIPRTQKIPPAVLFVLGAVLLGKWLLT